MPEIKVVNMAGADAGTMKLSDKVFGAEVTPASSILLLECIC